MAIDNSGSGSADPAADPPPISRHPRFPAVVALWFAALLGLGSLILPVILLERVVEATGLAALVPAASPPLGWTARFLIAGIGAVLGAGLGRAIAHRVASAQGLTVRSAAANAATRRPISAHDELGDEGLGMLVIGSTRRRSLALSDDDEASDDYSWLAPLPGEDHPDTASRPFCDDQGDDASEPLELSELFEDAPAARFVRAEPTSEIREPHMADALPLQPEDEPMTDAPPTQFPTAEERERRRNERRTGKPGAGPAGLERRLFLRRGGDEPLPFSAPSFGRRAPADNENMPAIVDQSATEVEVQASTEMPAPAAADAAPVRTAADWATAPVDSLGMVQLVQRLAASLEQRRRQSAEQVAPAPLQPPVPADFEAARPEQAAQATAAYFGRAPAAAADAVWLDGHADDDFDWADSFARPATRAFEPLPEPSGGTDEVGEEAGSEELANYGSLLNLAGPPERTFDLPAGTADPVPPAPAAIPPAEADEALRKAIATLQRMSSHG